MLPSTLGSNAVSRAASTQRSKSVQSSHSTGKRKSSISAAKSGKGAKKDRAPPLVPSEDDENTATTTKQQQQGKAAKTATKQTSPPTPDVLPVALTNPVNTNYGGKHMHLEECGVGALIDKMPELLKGIKRMCLALDNPATATAAGSGAESTSTTAEGRVRDVSPSGRRYPSHQHTMTSSPASAPTLATTTGNGAPNCVVATRRQSTTSPSAAGPTSSTAATESSSITAAAAASANNHNTTTTTVTTEADRIIEATRAVGSLLFPITSLQTAKPFALPVATATTVAARRRKAATASPGGAVDTGKDSALAYYHSTLHAVSAKKRRLAWKAFLHKSTNAFALLLGSLRCPAVTETPAVCVELVCLLYNVVRNIPATSTETSTEKEKKAVKLCERLGMAKVLGALMRHYHQELQRVERRTAALEDQASNTSNTKGSASIKMRNDVLVERYQCLRVLEAAALLYTEMAKSNVKINAMLRLSKDLRRTLDAARYISLACVLRTIQSHTKLSDFGCQAVPQVMKAAGSGVNGSHKSERQAALKEAFAKNRRDALKGLERVSRETSFYLGSLSHMLMVLFTSARAALAAQELGVSGVALCARVVEALAEFLYRTLPKVRRVITATLAEEGETATAAAAPKEPVWVLIYKRRVEMALFWAVALLQRICETVKRGKFAEELHDRNHVLAHLFLVLQSTGRESIVSDAAAAAAEAAMLSPRSDSVGALSESRRRSMSAPLQNSSFGAGAYDFDQYSTNGGEDGEQDEYLSENEEMTLAVMAAMKAVLAVDRPKALEELSTVCGGLVGVVKEVVRFGAEAPEQWHRYYMLMTGMYGLRHLPAKFGESAYEIDSRLPTHMFAAPPAPATATATSASYSRTNSQLAKPRATFLHEGGQAASNCDEDARSTSAAAIASPNAARTPQSASNLEAEVASVLSGRSSHQLKSRSSSLAGAAADSDVNSPTTATSTPRQVRLPVPLSPPAQRSVSAGQSDAPLTARSTGGRSDTTSNIINNASANVNDNDSFTDSLALHPLAAPLGSISPAVAALRNELLLVDRHAEWFSPELRLSGDVSEAALIPAESALEPADARERPTAGTVAYPWRFTETGPPATNVIVNHRNEQGRPLPLVGPTREQKVAVLKHQISRLRVLDEKATDTDPDWRKWHKHHVVYEREDTISVLKRLSDGGSGGGAHCHSVVASASATVSTGVPPLSPSCMAGDEDMNDYLVDAARPVAPPLRFCSNFESGNLKRAVKVAAREYDLVLNWDTSSNGFTQWFCFSIADYEPGATYRFNIINMEKKGSSFNDGQRPLMLWTAVTDSRRRGSEALAGAEPSDWQRAGQDIYYYRNPYGRADRASMQGKPFPLPELPAPARAIRAGAGWSSRLANAGRQVSPAPPSAADRERSSTFVRRSLRTTHAPSPSPSKRPRADRSVSSTAQRTLSNSSKRSGTGVASLSSVAGGAASSAKTSAPPRKASISTGAAKAGPVIPDLPLDFYSVSFSVTMPAKSGTVFLANCFPYTYAELRGHIRDLLRSQTEYADMDETGRFFTAQSLCSTLGGLPVPLITVTAQRRAGKHGAPHTTEEIRARPVCVLTARIHPGETNSSWMMHGMLEALLRSHVTGRAGGVAPEHQAAADEAVRRLLHTFVFKIVPMLNPDGVAMGNHRCSLAGVDLNRDYMRPNADVNPTIYAVHRYVQQMTDVEGRTVVLFADFHGHSKAKNFLMYGCTQALADALARRLAKDGIGVKASAEKELAGAGGDWPSAAVSPTDTTASAGSPMSEKLEGLTVMRTDEVDNEVDIACEKLFPILMAHATPSFDLARCSFSMQKAMRRTGRVLQYRKYGIRMSYTIEGTMVGGCGASFACPWRVDAGEGTTFSSSSDNKRRSVHSADASSADETHYTQDAFSALGHTFLSTLHTLVMIDQQMSSTSNSNHSVYCGVVPARLLEVAWQQLATSGSGKGAPTSPPPLLPSAMTETHGSTHSSIPVSPLELCSAATAAGSYVLATRTDRRTGTTPPTSTSQTPLMDAPLLQPSYTMVPDPVEAEELPDGLAEEYQQAMRYLFSTAASRVADDGDNEEESDGDNDSDTGPRVTQAGKRRATPASRRKKSTTATSASTSTVRRVTPAPALQARRVTPTPTSTTNTIATTVIVGDIVATTPAVAPQLRNDTNGVFPPPASHGDMSYVLSEGTNLEQPHSPSSMMLGTSAATVTSGGTAGDDDDADYDVQSRSHAPPSPTGGEDGSGGVPRPGERTANDANDDDLLGPDDAVAISLSDDDDVDDEDDDSDSDDDEARLARTTRTQPDVGGGEEDEYDENTLVDNGSDVEVSDYYDEDDDADVNYGELQPMPSNIFS